MLVGGAVSATLAGGILGATGQAVRRIPGASLTLTAAVVATSVIAAVIGFRGLPEIQVGMRRQTHPVWPHTFGRTTAALLWGLDLGTNLTTQSTYFASWLLPLLVLLAGDPDTGVASYLLFATLRTAPVVIGPLISGDRLAWAMGFRDRFARLNAPFAVAAGIAAVAVAANLS